MELFLLLFSPLPKWSKEELKPFNQSLWTNGPPTLFKDVSVSESKVSEVTPLDVPDPSRVHCRVLESVGARKDSLVFIPVYLGRIVWTSRQYPVSLTRRLTEVTRLYPGHLLYCSVVSDQLFFFLRTPWPRQVYTTPSAGHTHGLDPTWVRSGVLV